MKKSLLLLLVAFFSLNFTACSKDDDEKTVEGTYNGKLSVYLGTSTTPASELDDQNIYLTKTDATHYTLELKNFKFNSAITVPLIRVNTTVDADGKVTGTAMDLPITLGELGSVTADIVVDGSIISDNAKLNIDVEAPLQAGQDPIKMMVKFDGKKK